MPYSTDTNYTPDTFRDIMIALKDGVNERFGTAFTEESFIGTGFYKFYYPLVQRLLAEENTFAEVYAKLQDYIRTTNETIAIPKTPREGLIKTFKDAGYVISIEPQTQANAGTLGVCVDVDTATEDYATKKQEILKILKDYTVAGLYYGGTERGNVALSNGQNFEFGFYPPTVRNMYLQLTVTLSQNTTIVADNEAVMRQKLLANLADLYQLGNNFEPDKYFTISRDAPYASAVSLKWKMIEAEEYQSGIYYADFKELLTFSSAHIEVVID